MRGACLNLRLRLGCAGEGKGVQGAWGVVEQGVRTLLDVRTQGVRCWTSVGKAYVAGRPVVYGGFF